jgi:radical SAM superfamily enzyme
MVKQFEAGLVEFLELPHYVRLVVDTLEFLPPEMIVHRVTGDAPRETIIGPMWSLKKWEVLNAIDAELQARGSWQGKLWQPGERLLEPKQLTTEGVPVWL